MDLRFLRDLTENPGPFATVYLDVSHDAEDAARVLDLRWHEARRELADQGADPATLAALAGAETAADPAVGRVGRVLVAAGGRLLLDRALPEPPATTRTSWTTLPDLVPMLVDQPEPVTAVVVRVDETGGEILEAGPDARPERVAGVDGGEYLVHKVRGGGWSQLRMQERVEESWRRNTADVAERVDRQVAASAARVLVIAGDARSRSRLRAALGEHAADIAVELDHSGGSGGGDLAAAVAEAVLDVVTAERHAVLDRYDQAAGRADGLAVDGVDGVLAALRAEAVDTLLLDGGVERDTDVWISAVPTRLATAEEELRAIGVEPIDRVPVDAAMLRAAAASGAEFVPVGGGRTGLVGHPIADGVAALLRYPLPSGA